MWLQLNYADLFIYNFSFFHNQNSFILLIYEYFSLHNVHIFNANKQNLFLNFFNILHHAQRLLNFHFLSGNSSLWGFISLMTDFLKQFSNRHFRKLVKIYRHFQAIIKTLLLPPWHYIMCCVLLQPFGLYPTRLLCP